MVLPSLAVNGATEATLVVALPNYTDDGAAESMLAMVQCWTPMVHGDPANFLPYPASKNA
jgi:hypothetical protein